MRLGIFVVLGMLMSAPAMAETVTVQPGFTSAVDFQSQFLRTVSVQITNGALIGQDQLTMTPDPNPPAAPKNLRLVSWAVDLSLASGKTELPASLVFYIAIGTTNAVQTGAAGDLGFANYSISPNLQLAYFIGTEWLVADTFRFNRIPEWPTQEIGVRGQSRRLGKFALVVAQANAALDGVTVYPNPYQPDLASHAERGIRFTGLPRDAQLKVYDAAGALVKTLNLHSSDGEAAWNAKTEDGDTLAAGLYFYTVTAASGRTVRGKLAVQR